MTINIVLNTKYIYSEPTVPQYLTPRRNWDPHHPLSPQTSVSPQEPTRGDTLAVEGGGVPIRTTGEKAQHYSVVFKVLSNTPLLELSRLLIWQIALYFLTTTKIKKTQLLQQLFVSLLENNRLDFAHVFGHLCIRIIA